MNDVPDYLANRGRRGIGSDSVQGMGMPPVPQISLGNNRFTLIDASGDQMPVNTMGLIFPDQPQGPSGAYLDAVLVDSNPIMSRTWYEYDYDPNAQTYLPPSCWSDNGKAPSTHATNPQASVCGLCRWSEWGSKINNLGHEIKACDDVRKLAWYVPWLGLNTLFLMRLKGSSHKSWSVYVDYISSQQMAGRMAEVTDVITRIYFDPGSIGKLKFTAVGRIDRATADFQELVWEKNGAYNLLGKGDQPRLPLGYEGPGEVQYRIAHSADPAARAGATQAPVTRQPPPPPPPPAAPRPLAPPPAPTPAQPAAALDPFAQPLATARTVEAPAPVGQPATWVKSPDGKHQLNPVTNAWEPIAAPPPAPPPPPPVDPRTGWVRSPDGNYALNPATNAWELLTQQGHAPARRGRKPRGEPAAAPAPAQAAPAPTHGQAPQPAPAAAPAGDGLDIPDWLKRTAAPAANPPAPAHGVMQAATPTAEVSAAITEALKLGQ